MATIDIRPAKLADAAEMAPAMRAADAAEVMASSRLLPLAAVEDSIKMSTQAWTVRVDGEIMCIWGFSIVSLLGAVVMPWLLTTHVVDRHKKIFMRLSKAGVRGLRKYALAINMVDARYVAAIRWAARLGFRVSDEGVTGPTGDRFIKIILIGDRHG